MKIVGVFSTEVYAIDDGKLVIEQAFNTVVRLAPDELPAVLRELQAQYDSRVLWQEPTPG